MTVGGGAAATLRPRGRLRRLNPIGLQELLGLMLLQERIHFDLVDGWGHRVVQHEVDRSGPRSAPRRH
jgi:hypothetical protein